METKQQSIYLTQPLLRWLTQEAKEQNRSLNKQIIHLLEKLKEELHPDTKSGDASRSKQ